MGFIASIEKVTEANWYKIMMPKLYGWGASLVILGALFKIEHWEGSTYLLATGLITEAVIFFFSAFEKTPTETDWTLVYPELAHMEDPDSAKRPAQQLDEALETKATSILLDNFSPKIDLLITICSKFTWSIK